MKKLASIIAFSLFAANAFAQAQVTRGEVSPGVYENIKSDGSQHLQVVLAPSPSLTLDPCASPTVAKNFTAINLTSATTFQIAAINGTTSTYLCSFALTISQVVTTANTVTFLSGTSASCGSGQVALSGPFGAGGVTAAQPIVVASGSGNTILKTAPGTAFCITTTIGGSANFAGVVTWVQQ